MEKVHYPGLPKVLLSFSDSLLLEILDMSRSP